MITTESVTRRIIDLFFSRVDTYAQSFINSEGTMGYYPSHSPVTEEVIYRHFAATTLEPNPLTIGTYSTSTSQEVIWIVLDIDAHGLPNNTEIVSPRQSVAAFNTVKALHKTLVEQHIPH